MSVGFIGEIAFSLPLHILRVVGKMVNQHGSLLGDHLTSASHAAIPFLAAGYFGYVFNIPSTIMRVDIVIVQSFHWEFRYLHKVVNQTKLLTSGDTRIERIAAASVRYLSLGLG